MEEKTPILEMRDIVKVYPDGTKALQGVTVQVYEGEILGLLGENGAGKTTLMKILFGMLKPTEGKIFLKGKEVRFKSPADAIANGIGMVHQHFTLVDVFTALENIILGMEGHGLFSKIDLEKARGKIKALMDELNFQVPLDVPVENLPVGVQQRVEILKMLYRNVDILILDEPTAVLTPIEVRELFAVLRKLKAQGKTIIFISHKLNEVRRITTRVVILRQGKVAAAVVNDEQTSRRRLAELMCGRDVTPPEKQPVECGEALLMLESIRTGDGTRQGLKGISLTVHAGEIVGVAGVSGNGQRELADVVAGVLKPAGGRLTVAGRTVRVPSPRTMQSLGIGRIPEDRMGTGLITTLPLAANIVLPRIHEPRFSRFGFLRPGAIRRFTRRRIAQFGIRAAGSTVRTGTLSGGNLQKALLARELAWHPRVLLAAQPTRGLDVSAAGFVYEQFLALRQQGSGVLVISEDLEELFLLSDRIAVMFDGRIMDILPIDTASVERVGLLMAGIKEAA